MRPQTTPALYSSLSIQYDSTIGHRVNLAGVMTRPNMQAKSPKSLRLLKQSWTRGRIAAACCMTLMAMALPLGCVDGPFGPTETPSAPTGAAVPAAPSNSPTDATQHVMVIYNDCAVPDPAIDA